MSREGGIIKVWYTENWSMHTCTRKGEVRAFIRVSFKGGIRPPPSEIRLAIFLIVSKGKLEYRTEFNTNNEYTRRI